MIGWSIRSETLIEGRKTIKEAMHLGVPIVAAVRTPHVFTLHHSYRPSHQVPQMRDYLHRAARAVSTRKSRKAAARYVAQHLRGTISKCGYEMAQEGAGGFWSRSHGSVPPLILSSN